jgi:hypothetical protein
MAAGNDLAGEVNKLRERVTVLEKQVTELMMRLNTQNATKEPWWERAGRYFGDDEAYQEFLEILRENRRKDYEAACAEADAAEAAEAALAAEAKSVRKRPKGRGTREAG